ncbi:DNA-binding protein [Paraburkholderia lycopersici]|uniref:Replication region DNA-binding N-term n=1 Tax=Paraburkholderia lycopersici TaxID=416944 RepID=A0A1G6YT55_9BURK|nr:DNA-binding protein [Paraburkholderia lycopersici]SDD92726.1 replication region DNA-binding N-term [Paraburkholderia lycopersici]
MSSSITITDELVAEIANRMADEGQKVTPMAIWSEVHTGSVVSVAASLRKWREERGPRVPQVVERPALPQAVTDTMRDALDRLWTSAQDEAERAVARRLLAMRERVEDASGERDLALEELQTTVQELDALQGRLDQMTSAYEQKADAVAGLEEDIALAMQRSDAAEKRAAELAERVSTLEAELAGAMSELAAHREAASRAAEDANESAQAEPVAASGDDASVRAAQESAHAEAVARLEGELEAIRAALRAEQDAHAAQREEAAAVHAERDAAALELQNAQAQLASLTDERDAGTSEIARLSASLAEAQQRAAELAGSAVANEAAEGADAASAQGADAQEIEVLKAQIARDAQTHAAAVAEARETVKKWSEYANGLKQQLTQASEKALVGHARSAGEATLNRRLAAELGQVQPEHELLRKEIQQQVVAEAVSAQLEQQGYHYDAATGVVSKLNTEASPA